MKNISTKTAGMVQLSLLGAIIVLMAAIPFLGYIPLGIIRATIIHVPVIIGSIVLGPKKGAILGTLFAITSLINNTLSPTITSFVFTPFYQAGEIGGNPLSLIICFLPRILTGVVPYYVYNGFFNLFEKARGTSGLSAIFAGICGSLTNTVLVMNMIYFFFGKSYAAKLSNGIIEKMDLSPGEIYTTFILPIIALNGVLEAFVAAILTAAIAVPLIKLNYK